MAAEPEPVLRIVRSEAERAVTDVTAGTSGRLSTRQAARHLSDEVVAAAKAGETAAWEAAFLTYGRELKGFLMVRLQDREDAEEAFSETFLRAIDRSGSLRKHSADAFRAWLYRIARNVATDRLRVRGRLVYLADPPDSADLLLGDCDDAMVASEESAAVRCAFAELPRDDQEVLWLRQCAGLSSQEVGAVVGKRPSAVRMQQQRALIALSRRLEL
ncbi:MAG: RNA polymerase sigma factor [Acidimicrobiales bacterium]